MHIIHIWGFSSKSTDNFLIKVLIIFKSFWRYSLNFRILEESVVELVASSHISRFKEILFLILSLMYFMISVNKLEVILNIELDFHMSSIFLSGRMITIGLSNKSLGRTSFSSSFTLSFKIRFSFSISSIEYFRASTMASCNYITLEVLTPWISIYEFHFSKTFLFFKSIF